MMISPLRFLLRKTAWIFCMHSPMVSLFIKRGEDHRDFDWDPLGRGGGFHGLSCVLDWRMYENNGCYIE